MIHYLRKEGNEKRDILLGKQIHMLLNIIQKINNTTYADRRSRPELFTSKLF